MTAAIVIGNPKAGRGKTDWDGVLRSLRDAGIAAEARLTEEPGHAIAIARQGRRDGVGLVIAAGGDGTVHEVANGLLADGDAAGDVPTLGILPLGSGCDYAKTFAVPDDVAGAVAVLSSERPARAVDVGRVTYRSEGAEAQRYFVNIAEVGIGAATVARAATLPRALGGAVYGLAFVMTLPGFRRLETRVTMDGDSYEGSVLNLVVANGQVFGGGMRVAPQADPADGLFDVQVHVPSKPVYVANLPKVYKGTHLPHAKIEEYRTGSLQVVCDPAGLIETDGEVLGTTPATFTIMRGALRVKA